MSGFARFILVNYKQDLLGKNTADNTFDHENLIAVLCNADFTPCRMCINNLKSYVIIQFWVRIIQGKKLLGWANYQKQVPNNILVYLIC